MINITFELNLIDEDISDFELGNISFNVNGDQISSKGNNPDQSFMIFISLVDLLDGIQDYMKNQKRQKKYVFKASDSSFDVLFEIKKSDIYIKYQKQTLKEKLNIFLYELYNSSNAFYKEHLALITDKSGVFQDLEKSLSRFKKLIK
ncbi:hypothetical protein AAG747_05750 [Rapidithrix thailandica]|uniref:Uncharacterized protein n=1 Tax=Rapidithrix thailandica TaxID=413964 RepID=A0AAW9S4V2_9BACT